MRFETSRLIVRDFLEEDLALLAVFRADSQVAQYMDFEVENYDDARRWLLESIGHNRALPRFSHHSAVILRDEDVIAGWIAVGHPENKENSIADRAFGYALGKTFWGLGIMPEAVRGMLRFCFDEWKVGSVSAQCSKAI